MRRKQPPPREEVKPTDVEERLRTLESDLGTSPDKLGAFLSGGYLEFLSEQLVAADNELNTTINWGITLVGGVTGLISTNVVGLSEFRLLVLVIGFVFLTHLLGRTARAYVDLSRWSMLSRRITAHQARQGVLTDEAYTLFNLAEFINEYHLRFACPMASSTLFAHLFFGFGYLYLYSALALATIFVVLQTSIAMSVAIPTVGLGITGMILELRSLFNSYHLRRIEPVNYKGFARPID